MLAIAACAPQTEVIKLYDSPDRASQDYERLLVISVAGDTGARRRLEELITKHLEAADVAAIAGYTETGLKTNLLQDEIDAAARNANADAILITHIVSVDTRLDIDQGRTEILSECRGGDPVDYFLYDHRELKEPDSVKIAHTVVAVTNLYDASDGVLQEEAKAIVKQLQIDKLVS
jgi:hypothetical protein